MNLCSTKFQDSYRETEAFGEVVQDSTAETCSNTLESDQCLLWRSSFSKGRHVQPQHEALDKMTRPISFACDPANRYCECGHCALPLEREVALGALAEYNRATNVTVNFMILVAAILAFGTISAWNTEKAHHEIVKARSV